MTFLRTHRPGSWARKRDEPAAAPAGPAPTTTTSAVSVGPVKSNALAEEEVSITGKGTQRALPPHAGDYSSVAVMVASTA